MKVYPRFFICNSVIHFYNAGADPGILERGVYPQANASAENEKVFFASKCAKNENRSVK